MEQSRIGPNRRILHIFLNRIQSCIIFAANQIKKGIIAFNNMYKSIAFLYRKNNQLGNNPISGSISNKKHTNTKWYRYDCVYEWFEPEIHKIYVKKTEEENMKIE